VVVCSVTVLAQPFGPGHHRQRRAGRPDNTATSSTSTVIIEALTSTQEMAHDF
jgi:hypothetical protein